MTTLTVVPSLPVRFTAPDRALLTKKFVEGMSQYAQAWDGPVVAVMPPNPENSTDNLDDAVFDLKALPFDVRSASFSSDRFFNALADADVVMLGGDHMLANLVQWCRDQNKKSVFVSEYSLKTRLQIVNAEFSNPIIRLRKYLWEWQQERRNCRGVAAADAVQCNGTPTFDVYRQLNSNALLYFDSRITVETLANAETLATRRAEVQSSSTIRLVYSGRLNSMKGADHLIEVARALGDCGVSFTLDIFGEGALRPVMEKRIREYNLSLQVRLRGVVDYSTALLPYIRNNVDLFVCCHRQGDPSCTYLETFACGVPIVGYANEALSGLTRNSPLGWTTPLNQPEILAREIARLSNQPDEINAAASKALEFAREHTFEREFAARIAQIQSLLS
jgi:colanic acid/amylovoran biosynthesis glycosyltransferase